MEKLSAKGLWEVLKQAGQGFIEDKVPKLSSSLAHYTMFSIGPMLMVIIFFANLFWGQAAVEGAIVEQLSSLIGERAAAQIEEIIRNAGVAGGQCFARGADGPVAGRLSGYWFCIHLYRKPGAYPGGNNPVVCYHLQSTARCAHQME
jgi:hypothetical protein